jgi:cell division protein FtsI (penicillin-binding protein 3)
LGLSITAFHMSTLRASASPITLEGTKNEQAQLGLARIRWTIALLTALFLSIVLRLVLLGATPVLVVAIEGKTKDRITASRPSIVDRNGLELAMDLRVPSLYAEPRRLIDTEEAIAKLTSDLPDLDAAALRAKLTGGRGFVWIKRELAPALADRIFNEGIPGIGILSESKRFYPGGSTAAHILGTANIDNQGIAGVEKTLDDNGVALLQDIGIARDQDMAPVALSIDLRLQFAMRQQLVDALSRYQAIAAAGVILDIRTGEVLALSSLPDFDPNSPKSALTEGAFNRITAGKFELGSVFKIVTAAATLDSGTVKITDSFDARAGVRFGRFVINDFHGKNKILTVPEIFKYSSNVGAIRMMQTLGKGPFRAFLTRIGFDQALPFDLPEITRPDVPKEFSDVGAATAAFGQGLSITPLQMATAVAAFMNGGLYIPPTIFPRTSEQAAALATRVISQKTSDELRYLMRLNATEGSGSRANVFAAGYRIGGKTGTAEKVVAGRYSADKNLTTFVSAFPMEAPKYVLLVLLDEPKPERAGAGATAGWNAGEASGRIVRAIAPVLGIQPDFDVQLDASLIPQELRNAPNDGAR